jgi:opacity protein-like surface antigen
MHSYILRRFCKTVVQRVILSLLLSLPGVMPAAAQSISFGVKGGVPITTALSLNNQASSVDNYALDNQRYIVGPTFELGLPYGLAFEADALYKRLRYTSNPFGFDTFQATTSANSWEFPFLVKREFFGTSVHPFGNAGLSLRRVQGTTNLTNGLFQTTQDPAELIHPWSVGFAAGGGASIAIGVFKIEPEIRYTRWNNENFSSSNGVLGSKLNSVDFLVGLKYGRRP